MIDAAAAITRFAVHLDLLLLFGLAVYPLHGDGAARRPGWLIALAVAGLAASLFAFASMAAGMTGATLATLDRETVTMIALETDPGRAFLVRIGALALVVPFTWRPGIAGIFAGTALASLAWSGHAAMHEGLAGMAHRTADIVHLLAAGAWMGALALLLAMIASRTTATARLHDALSRFGTAGSILVGSILLTGLANLWFIVGTDALARLPDTLYGRLLALKLLAFLAMLALAANNRWRLTPLLRGDAVDAAPARRALRTSIGCETACAVAIVALVAILGNLSPLD
ncbi:copper homeostasis membrane protein CopD [Sphingomonas colocasiae]|uniref:Copper homeostasis membrane protein CopD n=1 Tax=Sphingomonas colocasiae TaxID=1848973 RepID=A0ABS7PR22_9SPHN|nr:copper homeostasis membrane protein CopD [Sphingomonas colocasiae]MBY8822464.1 copper homeostasis membrane protein CopD [Sphingomonas colocasiae]